jgi:carboxylesterase
VTRPERTEVLPGCEPWRVEGGPHGALVLHGFTGCPQSVRPLAEGFAAAGFAVEMPLLPGHGTTVDDLILTGWPDWAAAAEQAYERLAARVERVVVAGLSAGGTLTAWLAVHHPEVAGIVCVNPLVGVDENLLSAVQGMLDEGTDRIDAIGGDIADPEGHEVGYDATPLGPLLSLAEGAAAVRDELGRITCPALVLTSAEDHVVPPSNSDVLAAGLGGPVERVRLERSYHVATLDHDRDLIVERAVEFARRVTGA